MSNYDQQYQKEIDLFGVPYPVFEDFVRLNAHKGGQAVDIGCGQGRDGLMLARYGYRVTGVDSSKVGIEQMLASAKDKNLPVEGVVANFYEYQLPTLYDAIVLDSILHFEKNDREQELELLDRILTHLSENGFMFIFVHKSSKKEKELHNWLDVNNVSLELVKEGYIETVYEEKQTNFRTEFMMYMFILQRRAQ